MVWICLPEAGSEPHGPTLRSMVHLQRKVGALMPDPVKHDDAA